MFIPMLIILRHEKICFLENIVIKSFEFEICLSIVFIGQLDKSVLILLNRTSELHSKELMF